MTDRMGEEGGSAPDWMGDEAGSAPDWMGDERGSQSSEGGGLGGLFRRLTSRGEGGTNSSERGEKETETERLLRLGLQAVERADRREALYRFLAVLRRDPDDAERAQAIEGYVKALQELSGPSVPESFRQRIRRQLDLAERRSYGYQWSEAIEAVEAAHATWENWDEHSGEWTRLAGRLVELRARTDKLPARSAARRSAEERLEILESDMATSLPGTWAEGLDSVSEGLDRYETLDRVLHSELVFSSERGIPAETELIPRVTALQQELERLDPFSEQQVWDMGGRIEELGASPSDREAADRLADLMQGRPGPAPDLKIRARDVIGSYDSVEGANQADREERMEPNMDLAGIEEQVLEETGRALEAGDYRGALEQFVGVLNDEEDPQRRAEALAVFLRILGEQMAQSDLAETFRAWIGIMLDSARTRADEGDWEKVPYQLDGAIKAWERWNSNRDLWRSLLEEQQDLADRARELDDDWQARREGMKRLEGLLRDAPNYEPEAWQSELAGLGAALAPFESLKAGLGELRQLSPALVPDQMVDSKLNEFEQKAATLGLENLADVEELSKEVEAFKETLLRRQDEPLALDEVPDEGPGPEEKATALELSADVPDRDEPEPDREAGPPPQPRSGANMWLITATTRQPYRYDWKDAQWPKIESWTRTTRGEAQAFLKQSQVGDLFLAYQSSPTKKIVGWGVITDDPTPLDADAGADSPHYVRLTLHHTFDTGVKLDELKVATPDLDHVLRLPSTPTPEGYGAQPLGFSPVTAEQYAVIRELIRFHNPDLGPEALPEATVPARPALRVEELDFDPALVAEPIVCHATVRNVGNVSWLAGQVLTVTIQEQRELIWSGPQSEVELDEELRPGATVRVTASGPEPEEAGERTVRCSVAWGRWSEESEIADSLDRILDVQDRDGEGTIPAVPTGEGAEAPEADEEAEGAEPTGEEAGIPRAGSREGAVRDRLLEVPVVQSTLVMAPQPAPPQGNLVEIEVRPDEVMLRVPGNDPYHGPTRFDEDELTELKGSSPQRYGRKLFDAIIHAEPLDGQRDRTTSTIFGYDLARERSNGRLRLELHLMDEGLHRHWWEYLCDSQGKTPLTVDRHSPFYRWLRSSRKATVVEAKPLKILAAICNPTTLGTGENKNLSNLFPLEVAEEIKTLRAGMKRLEDAGLAKCDILESESGAGVAAVTVEELGKWLQEDYHVLHILAHGLVLDEGFHLVMEDGNRRHALVPASEFEAPLLGRDLRLVVLASCQSAGLETGPALQGLGPRLVAEGAQAVIAMQQKVTLKTAERFTKLFYDDLARSGCVDMALAATRFDLYRRDRASWEWGIPVLYMAGNDGKLFEVDRALGEDLEPLTWGDVDAIDPERLARDRRLRQTVARQGFRPGAAAMREMGVSPQAFQIQMGWAPGVAGAPDAGRPRQTPLANRQPLVFLDRLTRTVKIEEGDVDAETRRAIDGLRKDAEDRGLSFAPEVYQQIASALNRNKHLILIGPPGTGKTTLAHLVCDYAQRHNFSRGTTFATANSDWTTFDTVGGYVPTEQQTLEFRPGSFLESISDGTWLVIDEINRADIDKAFGELFTVLSGQLVDLPYKVEGKTVRVLPPVKDSTKDEKVDWVPGEVRRAAEGEENSEARYFHYVVHPNWRIVGTMNLYDKSSLFQMSFAFMRRFAFIDLAVPSPVAFYELVEKWFVENGLIEEGDKVPGATLLADLDTMLPLRATFRELLDQRQKEGHLMRIRAIGPAVIKDMIEYMGGRVLDGGAADPREYLAEAFLLYGVPQIDGLAQKNVEAVYKHLGRLFADVAQRATILQRIEALYPHIQDWPEVD